MATSTLLKENGIKNAIIVDDVFDSVPTANDLSSAEDEWSIFFDDVTDEDHAAIADFYPNYENFTREELRESNEFIAELWERRNELRLELTHPLFDTYVREAQQDHTFLDIAKKNLEGLGLEVNKAGSDFVGAAKLSDLIVIDLFLGRPQQDIDMEKSIVGLKKIINTRTVNPPIIMLISSSNRLADKANEFRDRTRVFASGFRTIKKSALNKPGRLEQLLLELARHRQDSLKLTRFARAWRTGVLQAMRQTESDIRRLDLEDWAQIRDLLLESEKVSTGSYILDVFDLVLLYEVESHQATITAATNLNSLQSKTYPPSTITGSKDTLALIFKTLFKHRNRRKLDEIDADTAIGFGDILGIVDKNSLPEGSIFKKTENTVFLVVTPACDLQRQKAPRVLLMAGVFQIISAELISKNPTNPRTLILKLPNEQQVCVDWQPHHIATLSYEELNALLDGGGVCVVGRLRDMNTVSIQQKLLSNLGRVGLVSPMPSTLRTEVRVFYPNKESELTPLSIGGNDMIKGICYVGRRQNKRYSRTSFDYDMRFTFFDALAELDDDMVHNNSLNKIQKSRSIDVVDLLFSRGVELDVSKREAQDWKALMDGKMETLGKILCNRSVSEHFKNDDRNRKNFGLVFEINFTDYSDSENQTIAVFSATE